MYRESDLVELKQQLTDEVKCEIDAFLNTKGGTIYIGVADDGTVMPFADEKSKGVRAGKPDDDAGDERAYARNLLARRRAREQYPRRERFGQNSVFQRSACFFDLRDVYRNVVYDARNDIYDVAAGAGFRRTYKRSFVYGAVD